MPGVSGLYTSEASVFNFRWDLSILPTNREALIRFLDISTV